VKIKLQFSLGARAYASERRTAKPVWINSFCKQAFVAINCHLYVNVVNFESHLLETNPAF
jgi:hypothetical protein